MVRRPGAELVNATAGWCLAVSSGTGGVQAWISPCKGTASQKWTQPAGPVVSEVPGACLNDQGGSSADANPVVISSCDGQAAQNWTVKPDGTLRFAGKCLDIPAPGRPAAPAWTCFPATAARVSSGGSARPAAGPRW